MSITRADVEKRLLKSPDFKGMSFEDFRAHMARKYQCPSCGKPIALRERHADGALFLGCSGFPSCRWSQSLGERRDDLIQPTPIGGWKPWDFGEPIPEPGDEGWDDYESDLWAEDWESPFGF